MLFTEPSSLTSNLLKYSFVLFNFCLKRSISVVLTTPFRFISTALIAFRICAIVSSFTSKLVSIREFLLRLLENFLFLLERVLKIKLATSFRFTLASLLKLTAKFKAFNAFHALYFQKSGYIHPLK